MTMVAIVTVAASASAQEQGVDALLKGAPKGFNAALEGERRLGMYVNDRHVGWATTRIERAPAGSAAGYQVTSRMQLTMPGFTQDGTVVALLDERFALVERRGRGYSSVTLQLPTG
jgi:hypothetical protein